jgi:hypothetical protein
MNVNTFPSELLICIGSNALLPILANLTALNSRFHTLLRPVLYKRGVHLSSTEPENTNPAAYLIHHNRASTLRHFLHYGLSADTLISDREFSKPQHPQWISLLHLAVHCKAARDSGDQTMVKLLLDHGAKPEVKDAYRCTPLHYSVYYTPSWESQELVMRWVRMLVEKGADVDASDCWGRTPLHEAARADNEEAVRLLLSYGAKRDARDVDESTALRIAIQEGSQEAEKVLRKLGAVI